MAVWIRLALAALVVVGAIIGIRSLGEQPILVENVRATSHGGGLIGVTMDIRNTGAPDRLVSVAAPDAEMALVKSYVTAGAPIPADSTVSLVMEGAHVMLGKVSGPMEEGRLIPLELTFENAGTLSTKAIFGEAMMNHGAMDHSAMGGMSMDAMGMDYVVPEGEAAPTLALSVTSREDGKFDVALSTTGFEFSREKADGPHEAGFGHGHLYVGGVKLGRVYGNSAVIPPLPPGKHLVRVTLNTNDHRTYVVDGNPVTATVEVTVE